MGYWYHELVPPAILLDNPGLTKEEFANRIGQVGVEHPSIIYKLYRQGVHGLAEILQLPYTHAFQEKQKIRWISEKARLSFKPNFVYDFSQPEGQFPLTDFEGPFFWLQKKGNSLS